MTTIRIANPDSDFATIAELLSSDSVEPVTAAGLHEDYNRRLPGKIRRWWIIDPAVACATVVKYPSEPADLFQLEHLLVRESHRKQGIGSQLFESVLAFAVEHGAGRLMAQVRDNDPDALAFAQQRGFEISHHVFDSVLEVSAFDESHFEGLIEQVEATGIRFFTLADQPDILPQLYELNRTAALEEPGSTGGFPVYENWLKIVVQSSWYRPESQFIAADGDTYVGLAGVYNEPEVPERMFNGFTGTIASYRGRKIATALKLLTIRYAKQHHAEVITTENDARNAPMLAINRKLGFSPLPGHYVIVKSCIKI